MFVFTLLGMEIFGHKVKFDDYNNVLEEGEMSTGISPRPNFDSFYMALTTIFIVFIGEDWHTVMFMHYRVVGHTALVFFPFLYIFMNLILLNLFLAILLHHFVEEGDEETHFGGHDIKAFRKLYKKLRRCYRVCRNRKKGFNVRNKIKPGSSSIGDMGGSGGTDEFNNISRKRKKSIASTPGSDKS